MISTGSSDGAATDGGESCPVPVTANVAGTRTLADPPPAFGFGLPPEPTEPPPPPDSAAPPLPSVVVGLVVVCDLLLVVPGVVLAAAVELCAVELCAVEVWLRVAEGVPAPVDDVVAELEACDPPQPAIASIRRVADSWAARRLTLSA